MRKNNFNIVLKEKQKHFSFFLLRMHKNIFGSQNYFEVFNVESVSQFFYRVLLTRNNKCLYAFWLHMHNQNNLLFLEWTETQ